MHDTPVVSPTFALDALLLLQQGRPQAALDLAADGVRCYPTYIGGYVALADCFASIGKRDDAQVILNEADRRFPDRAVIRQRRTALVAVRPAEPAPQPTESPLRIIALSRPDSDTRVIRSSAVRLIPGLEYTSLRFESQRRSGRSVSALPEPPAFRHFHAPSQRPSTALAPRRGVSLEELANRIGKVRITAEELEKRPPAPDPMASQPRVAFATETLAQIYVQQKSYDQAIEAYTQLMQRHPDRADHFAALRSTAESLRDADA